MTPTDRSFLITDRVFTDSSVDYFVVLAKGQICTREIEGRPQTLFDAHMLAGLAAQSETPAFNLGTLAGKNISVLSFADLPHALGQNISSYALRELYSLLAPAELGALTRAAQLVTWHNDHQFCGRCGRPTRFLSTERAAMCEYCDHHMYPRLAPCAIGVVCREDKILLANGVKHREGMYSALAGFVEAGESAEQAFVREVREEVGIEIQGLEYITSQNWPFPHQLMLAFIAEYKSGDIVIDETEITDANWYGKGDLPELPPSYTISRRIIDEALSRI